MSQELNRLVTPLLLAVLPAIEARIPRPVEPGKKQRFDNGRPANESEAPVIQDFFSNNPAILMKAMRLTGSTPGEPEAARILREEKEKLQDTIARVERAEGTVEIPVSIYKMRARLAEIKKESEAFVNEKYESSVFTFLKTLLTQFSNGERLHGLPVGSLVSYAEAHKEDLSAEDQEKLSAYIARQAAEKTNVQENGLPEDLA